MNTNHLTWFAAVLGTVLALIHHSTCQDECPLSLQREFTISYQEIDLTEETQLTYKKSYYKGGPQKKGISFFNNAQDYLIKQTFNSDNGPQVNKRLVIQQVPNDFVQQQLSGLGQQMQQVFQNTIPEDLGFIENTDNNESETTTAAIPEREILRKWFVNLPRSSLAFWGARMTDDGSLAPGESFNYNIQQLQENNSTVFSGDSLVVDMSDYDWVPYSWYLICAKQQYVINGNLLECQHCGLVKSEGPDELNDLLSFSFNDNDKVLDMEVVKSQLTAVTATIQVQVYDLPVPSGAAVTIKAIPLSEDERCQTPEGRVDSRHTDPIYPNTVTVRTLTRLSPATAYTVELDLIIPLSAKDGATMGLKSQTVVIRGYAETTSSLYKASIPKCD